MISAIEENLIALVKQTLPGKLKVVDSLPGELDAALLKKMAASSPAVYFSYLGGRLSSGYQQQSVWAMYMVTALGDEKQRRVGDGRNLSAYDLLDILVPVVHEHSVPDVGSFTFDRVQNLFSMAINNQGITIYAATYTLPMSIEYKPDLSQLNNFITYSADHSLVAGENEPSAQDNVTLEQI